MSKKTIYLLGILATLIIGFFLHWHFCCNEDCTKNAVVDETSKRNASAPLPFKFEDGDITYVAMIILILCHLTML
jgi:hypothetical protein